MHVKIYKGNQLAETYLFVAKNEELERVPEALLDKMGALVTVLELDLHPDKQLVRSSGEAVLAAIAAHGYYLQLPPPPNSNLPGKFMHERLTK